MKISNHQMCIEGRAPLFIMITEKQIERSRKEQETNEQGKMRGEFIGKVEHTGVYDGNAGK